MAVAVAAIGSSAPRASGVLFARRFAALAIDAAVVAPALFALVYGGNALGGWFGVTPFRAFWAPPPIVQTSVEPLGEADVPLDHGVVSHQIYSREIRVAADGAVFVHGVLTSRLTAADGTVTTQSADLQLGESAGSAWRTRATLFLAFVLPMLYGAVMESSRGAATFGKRALGLRVVDQRGRRIGFGRSCWRQLMKLAEVASTGAGYLLATLTDRNQAFHDILAGTLVVPADDRI